MGCKRALVGLLLGLGCASQPPEARRPVPAPASQRSVEVGEGTVPPDKVDEIHDTLTRKGQDLEHCWRQEVARTSNPKWTVDFMLALTVLDGSVKHSLRARDDQFLLEAVLEAGASVPFSCTLGGCGSCKVKLEIGDITLEELNGVALPTGADYATLGELLYLGLVPEVPRFRDGDTCSVAEPEDDF